MIIIGCDFHTRYQQMLWPEKRAASCSSALDPRPKKKLGNKSFPDCTFGCGKDSTRFPDFRNFFADQGLFYS